MARHTMCSLDTSRQNVFDYMKAATSKNKMNFEKGVDTATSEYIYPNQHRDAARVMELMCVDKKRIVVVPKKVKVGADGFMIQLVYLMCTHPSDDCAVHIDNVRIITGMSNKSWQTNMRDKVPDVLSDKVIHHDQLKKTNLNLKNGLYIIDEVDTGDKPGQVLQNVLKNVLDAKAMVENNNRFVFISATMIREMNDLFKWNRYNSELIAFHKMEVPKEYFGHIDFLNAGILLPNYPITDVSDARRWVQEDIVDYFEEGDFRVHLIRVSARAKTIRLIKQVCGEYDIPVYEFDCESKLSSHTIDNIFYKESLEKHVVIAVKNFYRRANLIPNSKKVRLGAIHELCPKGPMDHGVQMQGLVGRNAGYIRPIIEGGHRMGRLRCSIQAVLDYEEIYNDPERYIRENLDSQQVSGNTMYGPAHIPNLVPDGVTCEDGNKREKTRELVGDVVQTESEIYFTVRSDGVLYKKGARWFGTHEANFEFAKTKGAMYSSTYSTFQIGDKTFVDSPVWKRNQSHYKEMTEHKKEKKRNRQHKQLYRLSDFLKWITNEKTPVLSNYPINKQRPLEATRMSQRCYICHTDVTDPSTVKYLTYYVELL